MYHSDVFPLIKLILYFLNIKNRSDCDKSHVKLDCIHLILRYNQLIPIVYEDKGGEKYDSNPRNGYSIIVTFVPCIC